MNIKKLYNTEYFQGKIEKQNYFEGWFYKLEDSEHENVMAIIIGIATGESVEDLHAFIQINDSITGRTEYIRYDINKFKHDTKSLWIKIDDNVFTDKYMRLNINGEIFKIKGMLYFEDIIKYPKTMLRPSIMGVFSYIPFLECNHGVVNISHKIMGEININDEQKNFSSGYGYIEKDWGTSFPSKWLWIHSAAFGKEDATLMLAIADIPFMGKNFIGIIGFIYINGEYHSIATYNGAYIKRFIKKGDEFFITVKNLQYSFYIRAKIPKGGELKAPSKGMMTRDITETIKGEIDIIVTKNKKQIFKGRSINSGIELSGNIENTLQNSIYEESK